MEILDVLDENGKLTGKLEERKIVHEKGLWHIHVGVWIMNSKGELLFQKRSENKEMNPNCWTRTGGHVDAGETPIKGIQRETAEEIGVIIKENQFELIKIEKMEAYFPEKGNYNRHFTYSYFAMVDYKIEEYTMQKEEVSELKYITIEELENAKKNNDKSYTIAKWGDKKFNEIIEILKQKRKENIEIEIR